MFYKVISGQTFVGIATQFDFRYYQYKNHVLLACDARNAQYIVCNDEFYHADWMTPVNDELYSYTLAQVIEIDAEEYDTLYQAIHSGEEIVIQDEPEQPEQIIEEEPLEDEITVPFLREKTIQQMEVAQRQIIYNGVDVTLSDGNTYHFALTLEDQINLASLGEMAKSGVDTLPYHADGAQCKDYSAEDILRITTAATMFKIYHTTYFNSLKAYINSLRSINTLSRVTYGMEIPERYQSDVLKRLLSNEAA